jgi:hypothetical protein
MYGTAKAMLLVQAVFCKLFRSKPPAEARKEQDLAKNAPCGDLAMVLKEMVLESRTCL